MDSAAADLIHTLQLQDPIGIQDSSAQEQPETNENLNGDAAVAINPTHDELRANASVTNDHHFADSVGQSADPDALSNSQHQPPKTPNFDQAIAHSTLSGGDPTSETLDSANEAATNGFCIVCMENAADVMTAPCGDSYCKDDISQLFEQSLIDESLFPPRCCRQVIPLDMAKPFLSSEVASRFETQFTELSTPNRTYCHNKDCARFVPPSRIANEKASCENCDQVTCAVCKGASHDGDCPEDPAHQSFLATAHAAGFQTCYNCNRMVELNFGCNHITYA